MYYQCNVRRLVMTKKRDWWGISCVIPVRILFCPCVLSKMTEYWDIRNVIHGMDLRPPDISDLRHHILFPSNMRMHGWFKLFVPA